MRARVGWCLTFATALTSLTSGLAFAEDSNYWTAAYGTRSMLLGGVVVGSPLDISSVYYNPGALALSQNSELLLSATAYKYQRVSVDGGEGPGRDLVSSWIAAAPSLFAGEIPILDHDRLAYSFLTRQSVDLEMGSRISSGSEVPPASPDLSALEIEFDQNVSENWFGLTWAHNLSPTLGFGISPYVAVRSQNTKLRLFSSAQDASNTATVANVSREFDYLHYRLLAKLGLSGVRDSLTYGVSLTTPGLGMFGGGNLRSNTTVVDESGAIGPLNGASYQDKLKSHYRSPLGVAAGASYGFGKMRLHGTVDWFGEVSRYEVLSGDPYTIRTSSGDSTVTPIVDQKLDAVLNWGIGIERQLSENLIAYASFHTDESARDSSEPANASVTSWDLKHVSAGATLHVFRSDFTLGASAGFSSQKVPPLGLAERVLGPNPDLESHVMMVTVLAGWKLVF